MKKLCRNLLAWLLAMSMLVTGIPVYADEAADTEDNEEVAAVQALDDSGTVTRAEWVCALVDAFNMTVEDDEYPDNYFSDLDSTSDYYYDVLVAVEFGVLEIDAGGPFNPDDAATREFAAHTLNFCLGYQMDEDDSYTFTDTADCAYPEDDQIAVDNGWLSLVSGEFQPEESLTANEMTAMLADAAEIYASTAVDESYNSQYVFADGVIIISDETEVEIDENNVLTLTNLEEEVEVGDTFVVYISGIPCAYVAESIEVSGDITTITTSEAEGSEVFVSVDAQGVAEADLSEFEAEEGATVTYVKTEAQAYSLRAQTGLTTIDIGSAVWEKKVTLSNGFKTKVYVEMSDMKLEYTINTGSNNYYIALLGDYEISTSLTVDMDELLGTSSITLGYVNIGAIGKFTVSIDLTLEGKVTATLTGDYKVGMQYKNNSLRLVKDFNKDSFTVVAEATAQIELKAALSASLMGKILSAELYAKIGVQSKLSMIRYSDGESPTTCTDLTSYLYASVGATMNIKFLLFKKNFSKEKKIYTKDNTPYYICYHYEDGQCVKSCTRGSTNSQSGNYFYTTSGSSRYGVSVYGSNSSTYTGDDGATYTLYSYELDDDNQATITKYYGNASAVVIPDEIDGYTVVEIGSKAFKDNTAMRTLVMPDAVTNIGDSAFSGCTYLSSVTFSESCTKIGNSAFSGCSALKSVVIPDSVTEIDNYAFSECTRLANVTLSKNLTTLGLKAFYNCNNLTSVAIPKSLTNTGDSMYSSNLGPFNGCSNLKTVTFEEGTTEIAARLFANCDGLETIEIPDTVTIIEYDAFYNCENLISIKIPDSVTEIENYAFHDCVSLAEVTLSKSLSELGLGTFKECDSLTSVEIPKSLTTTGDSMYSSNFGPFNGCSNLKTVTFEEGTTKIIERLFANCDGLETIEIPDTVTIIGYDAFYNCENLASIVIPYSVKEIEGYAFHDCKSLTGITIPETCTTLGNGVFEGCASLTSMVIPASVTNFGTYMFCESSSLERVEFQGELENITKYSFYGCTSLTSMSFR